MFTRVVEITSKTGKAHELASQINDKILPLLRQQSGFLDETILTSDQEPSRLLSLSFWKSREDAERYEREQYQKIVQILSPVLETPPVVRTFQVFTSTQHKIAAGRAA